MPLTELLRMISGNMDATQERASNSSNPSSRPETDFCELVWENGNVMLQGQSTQARKGPPTTNDCQTLMHKSQDGRVANVQKMNNFSTMDSVFSDFPSVVPSSEIDAGQDVEMVPWLSYPDSLHNDYISDFLPEFSGITMNRTENKSDCHGDSRQNSASLKRQDASKVESNTVKHSRRECSEIPRSGVSGITGSNVNNTQNVNYSRELNSSSLCAFTSLRLQKLDAGQPSTSTGSSFTNFPCFSRSAALTKTNHLTVNTSKRLENDELRCTMTSTTATDPIPGNLAAPCSRKELETHNPSVQAPDNEKLTEELLPAKRKVRKENGMNETQQNHAVEATMSKVGAGGELNMEPVVAASSVCSGNSVDIASNEHAYGLKRKLRETTESEDPSEEAEEESVGAKKAARARASSKRIRAAEVHNLSERRRRDRINEKMRALQELIPNCNKVDKASMLDEAIEYLKTLQLQLQMFSMAPGLYMQPMMLPPGLQPMHGAQMPHFSPMGLGMGMGMGLGMGMGMGFGSNMLDVNGGMKMMPFQSPHYSVPGATPPFNGMPGSSVQPFGHPGQGLKTSIQRGPIHPNPGAPPFNIPMGLDVSSVAGSSGAPNSVPPSNIPNIYMNQAPNQATKEGFQPSASSHDRSQSVNASGTSLPASGPNTTA